LSVALAAASILARAGSMLVLPTNLVLLLRDSDCDPGTPAMGSRRAHPRDRHHAAS
jgi:hypothetical protein